MTGGAFVRVTVGGRPSSLRLPAFDAAELARGLAAFALGWCFGWLVMCELRLLVELLRALAAW